MNPIKIETIDAVLVELGEPLFFGVPKRAVKAGRSMALKAPTAAKGSVAKKAGLKVDAKAIRYKLDALARRAPEVLVKISGTPTGMRRLRAHLNYISRNGEIELESQDGERFTGMDGLIEVRDLFEHDGYPIPEEGEVRESFNIVLSMPKGTDEVALKRSVREFAAAEFEHHQYVMAMHTWNTDPDPNPSPHPHVHLAVKARSDTGVRLNPRKADLQRWRETFVQTLRANGIEAVATKRVARMQRAPGERQSVRQMKIRGGVPNRMVRRDDEVARRAGAVLSDESVLKRYRDVAAVLRESPDSKDWRLALGLLERFLKAPEKRKDSGPGLGVASDPSDNLKPDSERKRGREPER